MLRINEKANCCGCGTCVRICPRHCVKLVSDSEGFLYPTVCETSCVRCGKCLKVCPMRLSAKSVSPAGVYAAVNKDESVRMRSSSGGVFSLLAEYVIARGGVVFGAAFDGDMKVVHTHAETLDGIVLFRGSKYVQSDMGSAFMDAERFLRSGREVLFSGTPCQIAGLKSFLGKDCPNLLTIDFVCHGVPSPGIFKEYLASQPAPVTGVNFRDKRTGWKNYSVTVTTSSGEESQHFDDDEYMCAFLGNLSLRPSCYRCRFRSGRSASDITLGDFWGIDKLRPELDDDKGVSLVIANNEEADHLLKALGCSLAEMSLEDAARHNPSVSESVGVPASRQLFFMIRKRLGLSAAVKSCLSKSISGKLLRKFCQLFT